MSFGKIFDGKRVLVTGAGRGIGRAIVAALHSHGAVVYALSKTQEKLDSLKSEFPNVIPICVDLANWDETRKAVETLERMDALINNAGVIATQGFLQISPEIFDRQIDVNLKAVINVSQIVTGKMIAEGKPGAIVNISSMAGKRAVATIGAYCCTKAGLEMLSRVMAVELGPHKITVNCVNPAFVATEMTDLFVQSVANSEGDDRSFEELREELWQTIYGRTPTKEFNMPMEDVVNAVLFLASGLTSQITGSNIAVDGGFLVA